MSKSSHLLSKQNSQQPKQFRGGEKKVMKKSLSLLVAIAMVFSMFATLASANTQTAGQYLESIGVIKGNGKDLLEGENWKRQDVAVILSRLLGKEDVAKATENNHEFSDVRGTFYNGYISWAKAESLMIGNTNGTFGFDNTITNKEFATVVLRALGVDTSDFSKIPELAVAAKILPEDTDWNAAAVRGTTYDVIKTALDTVVGDTGKKLGTILNLPGYEITALTVAKASAVVNKTITVEFSSDLSELKASDVAVKNADGVNLLVEKVSFEGKVATIALTDKLSNGKTYTVSVAAAKSKEGFEAKDLTTEVTYNKATPATIAFADKTVVVDKSLKVVIKDANGNDVTADFIDDVEVYTTDASIIGSDLVADTVGDVIVNVSLVVDEDEDVKIETGNEIITVVALTSLGLTDVSFNSDKASDNNVTLYQDKNAEVNILIAAKDQSDAEYKSIVGGLGDFEKISIKSLNPTIVAVDSEALTAKALQTGSATIQITAEYGGVKTTKNVVVTVKAAKALAGIELSTSSLRIAAGDAVDVEYTVEVKTVDQYGKGIDFDGDVTADPKSNKFTATEQSNDNEGKRVFKIEGTENGSTTIKFSVSKDGKTYSKTLSVTRANVNGLGGFLTESDAVLDIDHNGDNAADGAVNTTTINVFQKDKNGVKFAKVTDAVFESLNKDIVAVDANGNVTLATKDGELTNKTGKATITVKVGSNIVARVSVEVVNTASQLKEVKQLKETIKVTEGSSIISALFGNGKALELINQYGKEYVLVGDEYTIATSNSGIVTAAGSAIEEGTATITVGINGTFYVVNVVVEESN